MSGTAIFSRRISYKSAGIHHHLFLASSYLQLLLLLRHVLLTSLRVSLFLGFVLDLASLIILQPLPLRLPLRFDLFVLRRAYMPWLRQYLLLVRSSLRPCLRFLIGRGDDPDPLEVNPLAFTTVPMSSLWLSTMTSKTPSWLTTLTLDKVVAGEEARGFLSIEGTLTILSSIVAPLPSSMVRTVYLRLMSSMATTTPTRRMYRMGWLRWKYRCCPY
jgi:hypothetical protein